MDEEPRSKYDIVLSTLFFIAIWVPLTFMLVGVGEDTAETENRELAPRPELSSDLGDMNEYFIGWEAYFNDRFGLRSSLVKLDHTTKYKVFNTSAKDKTIVGLDGWFFLDMEGTRSTIDYYKNLDLYTDEQMESIMKALESRRDWLADMGIEYYVVIAPNKHTIYPEYIPEYIVQKYDISKATQITEYIGENSDLNIIFLDEALTDVKSSGLTYEKTGTHWNEYGAFIGYEAIMDMISSGNNSFRILGLEDYKVTRVCGSGSDLSKLLFMDETVKECHLSLDPDFKKTSSETEDFRDDQNRRIQTFVNSDTSLPSMLVFRDSFANALIPYLSESSSFLWLMTESDFGFDTDFVLEKKPDVVIQQIVERRFRTDMKLEVVELDSGEK